MFTGIILAIGTVVRAEPRGGDLRLVVDASRLDRELALGDSLCVSGVCLTLVERQGMLHAFDVSVETLALTTLGALREGDALNLEPALRLSDSLGGHLVSGHVDGIGRVVAIAPDARSQRWTFELPPGLARYAAPKGSIAIDGVSLTINEVDDARVGVNLIPHTIEVTTLGDRKIGDPVNVEMDMVARYVERLMVVGK
jgi:riboflavin synthase